MSNNQVIVVGGGLSGLSACHTVLERGGSVVLLDKNPFLGGNSTKATSGINGALTRTQGANGVKDSVDQFIKDTVLSATKGASEEPYPLAVALVKGSAPAVHWLQDSFGLDLSLLGRLGGHSFPRTHRGKEKFPGMTITYALMDKLEKIAKETPNLARIQTHSRVTKLLTDAQGHVCGVEYTDKSGNVKTESGPVVLATGGYGADFSKSSLLAKYRPDVCHLPTTNGPHCTGDGIKLAESVGGQLVDMEYVQVHPTGLVHPDEPDAKVKFLAAGALRGAGGVILNADGKRFCDELGTRDYVSGEMFKNKAPFRLILNSKAAKEIEWHCKHYAGRGLMKHLTGDELAKEIGCTRETLDKTFRTYNSHAPNKSCPYGKKFYPNLPLEVSDSFYVGIITPVVHYTMGGIRTSTESEVCDPSGKPVGGLYSAGEIMGGTHGKNRLGGSSLLDCVVFGRVAGASVTKYLLSRTANRRLGNIAGQMFPRRINVSIEWDGESSDATVSIGGGASAAAPAAAPAAASEPEDDTPAVQEQKEYTVEEVAKHNTKDDCWVIVNGEVLSVSKFLSEHPGGEKAILLYAGKDATEEFNMLHEPTVIDKYPWIRIGTVKK